MSNATDPHQVLSSVPLLPPEADGSAYPVAGWFTNLDPPGSGIEVHPVGQIAGHWLYAGLELTIGSDLPPDLAPIGWNAICPPIPTGSPGTAGYVWSRLATGTEDDALIVDFAGPHLSSARVVEWVGVKEITPWPRDTNDSFVLSFAGSYQVWTGYAQIVPQPARRIIAECFDEIRSVGYVAADGLPPSPSSLLDMGAAAVGWGDDGYPGEPGTVRLIEEFRMPFRDGLGSRPGPTRPGFLG